MISARFHSFTLQDVWCSNASTYSTFFQFFILPGIKGKHIASKVSDQALYLKTKMSCIPVASSPTATPWNSCQHGAMRLSRIWIPQLQKWAALAAFVCVSAPMLLPVALWCQPAHQPPIRHVERSPAATAHQHHGDWGFLLDWMKCLLFPTLLEFNTSLFTGPNVAPGSLPLYLSLLFFSSFRDTPSLHGIHTWHS